ncbi:MAG TPA: endonuclease/exonuclease/phosphatase family protein [Candidatus Limnocylindrales bacterium]
MSPWAIWAIVRLGGWDKGYPATQLIAFTPYIAATSILPLAVVALMRRWRVVAFAAVTTVTLALCVVPRGLPDLDARAGADGPTLRVMSANLLAGAASVEQLVTLVRENDVDILAVQELTPEFAKQAVGLNELLPHQVLYPKPSVIGAGLYSRTPLRNGELRQNPWQFGQARAEVVQYGVWVESVHPVAPGGSESVDPWVRSFARQHKATPGGPLQILAGDFNATLDHSVLRTLISSGYRDAADVRGKGFIGTWGPYDGDRIPPVTLDRVLADRRIGVADLKVLDLEGSDHRPVVATLILP